MEHLSFTSPTSSSLLLDMYPEPSNIPHNNSNKSSIWRGFDPTSKGPTFEESQKPCSKEKNSSEEVTPFFSGSLFSLEQRSFPKSIDIINLDDSDIDRSESSRVQPRMSSPSSTTRKKIEVIVIDDDDDDAVKSRPLPTSSTEFEVSQSLDFEKIFDVPKTETSSSETELSHLRGDIVWQDIRIRYLEQALKKLDPLEKELQQARDDKKSQEIFIKHLQNKLTERDNLEVQLNRAEEKIRTLECSEGKLKQQLNVMQLLEWECQHLQKKLVVCTEDVKRRQELFVNQITTLKFSESALKKENEKLVSDKNVLEKDMASLKQKLLETEDKLKKVISKPSSGLGSSEVYCCNIKDKLVHLLENDYSCCICGDLYIEATITECNHIFCKYCLGNWKNKSVECPFCRANINKEFKANIIDECITTLSKLISDTKHEERLQLIKERKALEGPPPAKRMRVMSQFLEAHQPDMMAVRPPDFYRAHQADLMRRAPEIFVHRAPEIVSRPPDFIGARPPWLY